MSSLLDTIEATGHAPGYKAPVVTTDRKTGFTIPGGKRFPSYNTTGTTTTSPEDPLALAGLPLDLIHELVELRARYPHTQQGDAGYQQAAVALIRGSEWYRQTFPGIAEARALGFIGTDLGSEQQYRQFYLRYNQLYQQYNGRNMTWDEAYRLFANGTDPTQLGQHFQGAAYVSANRNDIQYLAGAFTEGGRLSAGQLSAYGDETAGFDSPLGQRITSAFQNAMQRYNRIFSGQLATPSLSLGGGGLRADSLLATSTSPDVQA